MQSTGHSRPLHPDYSEARPEQILCEDAYKGSSAVKEKTEEYLPPTAGMRADGYPAFGTVGQLDYASYLLRAYFPEIMKDSVQSNVGLINKEDATIVLPASMEYLRENCAFDGSSLLMFLRKVHERILISGRLVITADVMENGEFKLFIYPAANVVNWLTTNTGETTALVLDETYNEPDVNLNWKEVVQYKVLALRTEENGFVSGGQYVQGVMGEDDNLGSVNYETVERLGKAPEQIPFSFVNAMDLSDEISQPPLLQLARLAFLIYRGEADYRQQLFLQAQETLVTIGAMDDDEKGPIRTGTGAALHLPADADAKFIGISSLGLPEQRTSLENDYQRADEKASSLSANSNAQESGEALKVRTASQTTTLPDISKAGAAGVEAVLKIIATWIGANPDDVSLTANTKFTEDSLDGQTLVSIMTAKMQGAPISNESIHEWFSDRGLTDRTYEEELELMALEEPVGGALGVVPGAEG